MLAALLVVLAAGVSAEEARAAVPRANLSELTDAERATFLEVAREVFNYAGCKDTLAKCLAAGQKDPHAVRMAELVRELVSEGFPAQVVIRAVEDYYASFDPRGRASVKAEPCATEGKGPVTIVEFSDYQCSHCAAAVVPLHELVVRESKGKVRLCAKYFPFPQHPRARIAAACAEYARARGRFWRLNELIFSHQDALEDADLKRYAKEAGLDGDDMLKQVYAGRFDAVIEKDIREATSAGVDSTPALFFNGRKLVLPPRPFYLHQSVEDEREWSKARRWTFEPKRP